MPPPCWPYTRDRDGGYPASTEGPSSPLTPPPRPASRPGVAAHETGWDLDLAFLVPIPILGWRPHLCLAFSVLQSSVYRGAPHL